MSIKRVLLIPHLSIQNANALSSPFTVGFPAMTAWLGATHALQRLMNQQGFPEVKFHGTGVTCHQFNLQTYKGDGDFVHSIIGTGNPLDKNGNRPAFIEEARCHLEVTLIVEYTGIDQEDEENAVILIENLLQSKMKIAGGDIVKKTITNSGKSSQNLKSEFFKIDDEEEQDLRRLALKMMPGYTLIERRDLMLEAMKNNQDEYDAMDILLDFLSVKHRSEKDEKEKVIWKSQRKLSGWIIPVGVGFQGITPLIEAGKTKNQRDLETPHRFAESIVTLGEFVMPHRLDTHSDMLWRYHHDKENNLYLCQQDNNS